MGTAPARQDIVTRSRWRLVGRWLVLSALALVLCAAIAIAFYGRELSVGLVRAALGQFGVVADQIEMRSFGVSRLVLGPVRLSGGPSASEIAIHWSLPSLLEGRVTRVAVRDLAAQIRIDEGRIVIAGIPDDGETGGATALPFDQLELIDAQLDIATGAAKIATTLDATVEAAENGVMGRAALAAVATLGTGPATRVEAEIPEWHLRRDAGRMQLAFNRATVSLPEHGLSASGIDAGLDLAGSASARLSADLRDTSTPARFAPLALTARWQRDGNALVATGRIAAEHGFTATFSGEHDLASGAAAVSFETGPIAFRPDGLQPDDLVPIAGETLRRFDGTVSARGALAWRGTLSSRLSVTLEEFGFETGIARISDVQATLALNSVMPPRTPGPQRITGNLQIVGLPEAPLDLRLSLPGDDRLIVDAATLGLAGGTMGVSNLVLTYGETVRTAVEIKSVDLGAILALTGIDGLSGSGIIEGRIPVRIDEAGLAIAAGRLASTGPGVVRYTGAGLPDGAAGGSDGGDAVRLLRQALADFRYTDLELTLDRSANGEGSLLVNLNGANPAVLDNHPFAINIRLEADFDRLAAVLFNGYAAAEDLLRRMKPP